MNAPARWEPLRNGALPSTLRLIDEVFETVPALLAPVARRAAAAGPRVDVAETDKTYELAVEMPGVPKEAIKVEVFENSVTIAGEAPEPSEDGRSWLLRERAAGKLARAIALPEAVDDGASSARFADGVLYLTLQKRRATQAKRLEIN